ncbi:tetratricopeptide repeat protein [Photobacterium sp. WH77]|uniref:Ancillary SecYEG translocon subunit n=1 Tax=Photobacterium arenosum TaxID=2774143 RepID=A0ABR9BP66_9GAMM|nr:MULTISPECIES: tetratricopeptide repeat protein [Photobacterium]MBV7260519.1 tetratricopeptide repeat protein [Photobacterium sp. WH24]MCG2835638.1 tetratricopeptide repeat protein [Photobacterium sp. WH77]MCG2843251.1 tetratricopeptide repeat protein [Photobacterium sp. WH80]MBD8514352.1 tetratricopeptide repeat protein [Photobacterium arenosum]MDO6580878.1 tetratricopeptide repeat protein [Photobacterium sp. 2_MG-2023]
MDVNTTEEQQIESIKAWMKENGKAVVLGAVLGLGGLYGWRYYQGEVQAAKELASEAYTQTVQALDSGSDEAVSQAQTFINDNPSSQYAVLAALQLAKVQVDKGELDAAAEQLNWAISHTEDVALLPVAHTRLARILAAQQSYDNALAELDKVKAESWQGKVAELRGDILLQKGDKSGARDAYISAQQLGASPALQIKLDDLAQ